MTPQEEEKNCPLKRPAGAPLASLPYPDSPWAFSNSKSVLFFVKFSIWVFFFLYEGLAGCLLRFTLRYMDIIMKQSSGKRLAVTAKASNVWLFFHRLWRSTGPGKGTRGLGARYYTSDGKRHTKWDGGQSGNRRYIPWNRLEAQIPGNELMTSISTCIIPPMLRVHFPN